MAVHQFLVGTYARNVVLYGTRSFAEIPEEYEEPVKRYSAETYRESQIRESLEKGYISEEDFDEIMSYVSTEKSTES